MTLEAGEPGKPRFLLNVSGECFDDLADVRDLLHPLENQHREHYRNENAREIATVDTQRLLIVAGPGSGKSHLFMGRIRYWLDRDANRKVYVATFVRKLVRDLEADIAKLPDEARARVDVSTLHHLAFSLLIRNKGTSDLALQAPVRVIDAFWADVVWRDVLAFHPDVTAAGHKMRALDDQFHREVYDPTGAWPALRATYSKLCGFYNAVGFAYSIVLAAQAVEENPDLSAHQLWIVDEYQDFNPSEDHLILRLMQRADGVLLAGDDEQALYQTLKASSPTIIIGHYNDTGFAKAMLPFCSRCSYHVCLAASAFMTKHRDAGAIDKIYLPLTVAPDELPVQVVATAAPTSAVDYVRRFLEDHKDEYAEYLTKREAGLDTDPYLLILSQSGALTIHKNTKHDIELIDLVAQYAEVADRRSGDYLKVLAYATAGWHPTDNFAVRKMLYQEGLTSPETVLLIQQAIDQGVSLFEVLLTSHPDATTRAQDVAAVLDVSENSPTEAAQALDEILGLNDPDQLAGELASGPIRKAGAREAQDEEAVDTAGAIAPVALMTMTGSKGLSAHHVIVLGCDSLNMGKTQPLTFFVALTRARRTLHLIASRNAGGDDPAGFLFDLPEESCSYLQYSKTGKQVTDLGSGNALRAKWLNWQKGAKYAAKKKGTKR